MVYIYIIPVHTQGYLVETAVLELSKIPSGQFVDRADLLAIWGCHRDVCVHDSVIVN